MPRPRIKKTNLSVYLIKPSYQHIDELIDEDADIIEIEGVGHFAFNESHTKKPGWIEKFFGDALRGVKIFSANARGLLIVPIQHGNERYTFALAFGVGRHLLRPGVFEERFGLKTALSSADTTLRSIVKTSLGSVPKHSREQMSRDVTVGEFGIDIEQDLVSAVTARSRDPKFGKIITGRDALSVSVPVSISDLKPFLEHCTDRYKSTDYKANFDWIDQIAEVRNKNYEAALNAKLVQNLHSGNFDHAWMAVPEVISWEDVEGFRYAKSSATDLSDDLHIDDFLGALNADLLTIEKLKSAQVFMVSASTGVATHWSALNCIYAEVEHEDKLHVINNGKWYEVAQDFTTQVIRDYNEIPASSITLPDCRFKNEGDYNRSVAAATGMCCLDGDPIMHGGGHSRVEFCDLLTPDNKLIHVKRYGNSSVLSHLFSQGVVAGELFVGDSEFREKLNAKLPTAFRLADSQVRPAADRYEIVYAVISKSSGSLQLPFFSKVSLRNARRRLRGYGYAVTLKKILRTGA